MKKIYKQILAIAAVLTMLLSMVACQAEPIEETPSEDLIVEEVAIKEESEKEPEEIEEETEETAEEIEEEIVEEKIAEEPAEEEFKEEFREEPAADDAAVEEVVGTSYILNINSYKFHYPYCKSVSNMKESNKEYFTGSRDTVIARGFEPCKNCNP